MLKDLKPSTRQRFVALDFDFPPAERETAIVEREGAADHATAHALVSLGQRLRALHDRGLAEVPSTRLLIAAARLDRQRHRRARRPATRALVSPLSDDAVAGRRDARPGRRDLRLAQASWPKPKTSSPMSRGTRRSTRRRCGADTAPHVPCNSVTLADVAPRLDLLIGRCSEPTIHCASHKRPRPRHS